MTSRYMLRALLGALILPAAVEGGLGTSKAASQTEGPDLAALAKALEEQGAHLLAGKAADPELEARLQAVSYDRDSLRDLLRELQARRRDPLDVYVASRLLEPLPKADRDLVRQVVPTVQSIRGRVTPRPFPQYPDGRFREMKVPQYARDMPVEKVISDIVRVEMLRRQKMDADRVVAFYNEQYAAITVQLARLLLLAESREHDGLLMQILNQEEQRGLATFLEILDLIGQAARTMEADRARTFHTGLLPLAPRLRMVKKPFIDYRKPNLDIDANSSYGDPRGRDAEYPGIRVLTALNELAARVSLPKQDVPSKQDVDAAQPK